MKTPEEIKKGLEYLSIKDIVKKLDMWKEGIAYDYAEDAALDALALIQQLEAEKAELKQERDAAIHDISKIGQCKVCKYGQSEYIPNECHDCIRRCNYEWRGPCEENGGK